MQKFVTLLYKGGGLPGREASIGDWHPPAVVQLNGSGNAERLARQPGRRGALAAGGVSVVIPAKNEERSLPWVLGRMPDVVDEVILVDGESVDRTAELAQRVRPDIRIVRQPGMGKGDALRAGFAAARGDFIVMIDADGSMDPAEIPACIAELHDRRSGNGSGPYELVKGSRFLRGGGSDDLGRVRRAGNSLLLRLANALYGADFTDLCYGLIAFRRDQLDQLALESDGFEIETEIVVRGLKAGVRMGEVASFERTRIDGASNLRTWRDGARVLATILKEWTRGGVRDAS